MYNASVASLTSLDRAHPTAPEVKSSGLSEVDGLARDAGARGLVFVRSSSSVLRALAEHVKRRARAAGRRVICAAEGSYDDAWREVAARVMGEAATDPGAAARGILDNAGRALIVVCEDARTTWGDAVVRELARLLDAEGASSRNAALFLAMGPSDPEIARARVLEVDATFSATDAKLFWEAVATDPGCAIGAGITRLDDLEGWWSAARRTPLDKRPLPPMLSSHAEALRRRLALSRRSWRANDVERLGTLAALDELVAKGVVLADPTGRVAVLGDSVGHVAENGNGSRAEDALAVAGVLDGLRDPWAAARASELYLSIGDLRNAESAAVRSLTPFKDSSSRSDFWARWETSLGSIPALEARPHQLRAADLALEVGDIDWALSFAKTAAVQSGDSFEALLVLGRANSARGDVTTARIALSRAIERAPDETSRAAALVEMAQVKYLEGDIEEAGRCATEGLARSRDLTVRLLARNVLGKLLLSRGAWSEAEAHFADDAWEASLAGDVLAELRARLNRAVAFLSSGRLHEAQPMLDDILAEGLELGDSRPVAYALMGLVNIAVRKRDYAAAVPLVERAFEVMRRMGDKFAFGVSVTTLVWLRLQLGQVTAAEQALLFGRQAIGPGVPATWRAQFALVSARIHFARGNTFQAGAELRIATTAAAASLDAGKLGDCHRLAVRIALEDGDVTRAKRALSDAHGEGGDSPPRAELALLAGQLARASGEAFESSAEEALEHGLLAEDREVVREAHVLLHHAALASGDRRKARVHLDSALLLRNEMAEALPEGIRSEFLKRRDLAELGSLEMAQRDAALPESGRPFGQAGASARCSNCKDAGCRECEAPRTERVIARPRSIVGRDPAIVSLVNAIEKVGPSDATVLIRGESGTGKELVAEAIHEASPRRRGPLVKVNCAALVETLLLSELFGHEKGAFTGAAARKRGRFEAAEGGTLFLDEIGDISPKTQVALLRVLQEKTFERVGGLSPLQADVRIVCATHRDLVALVARGEFREDLYYRLRGIVLEVPALRQRLGDLGPISTAILMRIAAERGEGVRRLSPEALKGLGRHGWPGNVRELENALRAAVLFAEGDQLELKDFVDNVDSLRGIAALPEPAPSLPPLASLPPASGKGAGTGDADDAGLLLEASEKERSPLESVRGDGAPSSIDLAYSHIRGGVSLGEMKRQLERECISRALAETGGNITKAAVLLGMKRPRLSQIVKQYELGIDTDAEDFGV